MMTLDDIRKRQPATIVAVGGVRGFRRRLMEMGLVPGTDIRVVNVAPFGDPLEIELRSARLSIRRAEASEIEVRVKS